MPWLYVIATRPTARSSASAQDQSSKCFFISNDAPGEYDLNAHLVMFYVPSYGLGACHIRKKKCSVLSAHTLFCLARSVATEAYCIVDGSGRFPLTTFDRLRCSLGSKFPWLSFQPRQAPSMAECSVAFSAFFRACSEMMGTYCMCRRICCSGVRTS